MKFRYDIYFYASKCPVLTNFWVHYSFLGSQKEVAFSALDYSFTFADSHRDGPMDLYAHPELSSGRSSTGHHLPNCRSCPKALMAKSLQYREPHCKRECKDLTKHHNDICTWLIAWIKPYIRSHSVSSEETWVSYHFWGMLRQQTEVLSLVFFVDFCTANSTQYCDSYHTVYSIYMDSFNNPQKGNVKSTLLNCHQSSLSILFQWTKCYFFLISFSHS